MKLTQRIPAVLVTAALLASASLLNAQLPGSAFPRTEIFVGYTYIRAVPTLASGNRLVWLNGGSTSLAYNFTRSFGLVTDFGGYDASQLYLTGPGVAAPGAVDASGTAYTFLFGPRLSLRKSRHFTPFVQVLGGGAYATSVTLKTCTVAPCTPLPEQGSLALAAGGGLDIRLSHRLAWRAVQAEYLMTRFANTTTAVRSIENDVRLSSGLVFRFGGGQLIPPMPMHHAPISVCSADRMVVRGNSGRPVLLQAQAADVDGNSLAYTWTASSGTLNGASTSNAEWSLDGLSPGQYSAKLHVDDGHGGLSDCSVNVTLEATPVHPSLTCSVSKSPVFAGDSVQTRCRGQQSRSADHHLDNDQRSHRWHRPHSKPGHREELRGSLCRHRSCRRPTRRASRLSGEWRGSTVPSDRHPRKAAFAPQHLLPYS